MKRLATLSTLVALGLVPWSAASTGQPATPVRHFTLIQYNSPGDDLPITNAKLDAEWVTITNGSSKPVTMTGWHVHDAGGIHHYTFKKPLTLGAHKSVRLHTGKGTDGAANRYWGLGNYVWNNDTDTATLAAPDGTLDDTCHWNDPGEQHNQIQCG